MSMVLTDLAAVAHVESTRGPDQLPADAAAIMNLEFSAAARAEIQSWPGYKPTPLHSLTTVASELGIGAVLYKDEAGRFDFGSFKALGGAYEVLWEVARQVGVALGQPVDVASVRLGQHRVEAAKVSVVTATDGNHGRSVAWGAQRAGCQCHIYVHAEVSPDRIASIESFGATVVQVDGNYDDSVRAAAAFAHDRGATIVSDTSYPGYVDLPRQAMAAYTLMTQEIVNELAATGDVLPTHVFVQAGCGGLAGSVCATLWQTYGAQRPRFVIVEPTMAPCLFESGAAGKPVDLNIENESIMAGLSCGEISHIAWTILEPGVDDYLAIPDELVAPAMRRLADGLGAGPIVAGESAVAGLAALTACGSDQALRERLGLDASSRVLLLGTEGATDPTIYRQLVGRDPEEVKS